MRCSTILLSAAVLIVCPFVFAGGVSPVDWRGMPSAVRYAKKEYDKKVAKVHAEYDEAIADAEEKRQAGLNTALTPLNAAIDAAVRKAMDKRDLEEAMELKAAKDSLTATPSAEEMAVGTWKVEWSVGAKGTITLDEDGDARSEGSHGGNPWNTGGRWRVTDRHVVITWDQKLPGGAHTWEGLLLPLTTDGIVVGDNWQGVSSLKAKKVPENK